MGKEKAGFLTPKAIANRIKSKGLQKLRWYCQMCEKQCRDENGFKCHTSSEAHHRQMKIFMENGGKFISSYSSDFLKGYLDIVRRQFGGKRVHSNVVYQEYIKDKEHIHMNATRWHSLTGLCMWLGKQGICRVDETEKGWFIEYIDKDPEAESRRASEARMSKTEDEINRHFLAKQIEKAADKIPPSQKKDHEAKPLVRDDDNELIKLDIVLGPMKEKQEIITERHDAIKVETNVKESETLFEEEPQPSTSSDIQRPAKIVEPEQKPTFFGKKALKRENPLLLAEKKAKQSRSTADCAPGQANPAGSYPAQLFSGAVNSSSKRNALDDLMVEEEMLKEKRNRKDYWMTVGIEVKLVYRKLPRDMLYRHAVVLDLEDDYTAVVRVLNSSNTKIIVDQDHVETTIPPVGHPVLVVNGAYRGEVAIIQRIDINKSHIDMVIESGLCSGRVVRNVSMEDVCKAYEKDSC